MVITKVPNYIKAVYISLLIIIVIFVMIMGKSIFVPLLLSAYTAMLMTGFCNRLERFNIPRSLSAAIAILLFLGILTGIVILVVTQIQSFMADVEAHAEADLNRFAMRTNNWVKNAIGYDMGMGYGFKIENVLALIQSGRANMSELLKITINTASNILLLPVFIFFLLIYRDHFAQFIMRVFARQKNKVLMDHVISIREIVHSYLMGAGKVMLILGIANSAVLLMLGIKHAIFFGMLAGMLNIIPYLGPLMGGILPFLYALLTKDSLFYPVAVAVSFTLIQFLEATFLTPRITGANVSLNAFITFVGLLVGGAIWGIPGMILIIPTLAILKKLFELSADTEPYAYLFGEEDTRWFRRKKKE